MFPHFQWITPDYIVIWLSSKPLERLILRRLRKKVTDLEITVPVFPLVPLCLLLYWPWALLQWLLYRMKGQVASHWMDSTGGWIELWSQHSGLHPKPLRLQYSITRTKWSRQLQKSMKKIHDMNKIKSMLVWYVRPTIKQPNWIYA